MTRKNANVNSTISTDEAEDILYGDHITIQDGDEHRWYREQLVAFERDGQMFGFIYLDPASELQEDQDRFESDPVQIFPVTAEKVITVKYTVAESV